MFKKEGLNRMLQNAREISVIDGAKDTVVNTVIDMQKVADKEGSCSVMITDPNGKQHVLKVEKAGENADHDAMADGDPNYNYFIDDVQMKKEDFGKRFYEILGSRAKAMIGKVQEYGKSLVSDGKAMADSHVR